MVNPKGLLGFFQEQGVAFYAGVPDSQLKAFCDELIDQYGVGDQHMIMHNEGGAIAIAAGHYLATGKIPLVYMQNSGLGNSVNPIASLTHEQVYGIPMVLMVGWRGEPGLKDEPQHIKQGAITLALLEILDIAYCLIGAETTMNDIAEFWQQKGLAAFGQGRSIAFVVQKTGFEKTEAHKYSNHFTMPREVAIGVVLDAIGPQEVCVATTGKIARELYELREQQGAGHAREFLTVGSMGHASMIALGMAKADHTHRIWCFDGDGAAIMHLGSMGMIGSQSLANYRHIIFNNHGHDSVGGQMTIAGDLDFAQLATGCGYAGYYLAGNENELREVLNKTADLPGPLLIEVEVQIGSRADLGRPKATPAENRAGLMAFIKERV